MLSSTKLVHLLLVVPGQGDNNLGIYSHIETIRQPLLKREFGNDEGTLYEGTVVDFFERWAGNSDKKLDKEKRGREKIKQLIQGIRAEEGEILLSFKASGQGWGPTSGQYDEDWIQLDFDDSNWKWSGDGAG